MPGGMGFPEAKDRFLAVGPYPLIEPRYKASPWNGQKKKPQAHLPKAMEPGIPIGCGQCDACFERLQDLCEKRQYK